MLSEVDVDDGHRNISAGDKDRGKPAIPWGSHPVPEAMTPLLCPLEGC